MIGAMVSFALAWPQERKPPNQKPNLTLLYFSKSLLGLLFFFEMMIMCKLKMLCHAEVVDERDFGLPAAVG